MQQRKHYAPYYRVSHKDEVRGISIDVQSDHVEPYVRQRAGLLLPAYVDDGKSAFSEDLTKRPAFQRLLTDAKKRQFDVVVVYLFDRFGRRMRVALQAIYELQQLGVQVESATEPNDWLSQGINLLMAEQYSRLLSRRMKDVRRWEASQGRHVGPVPAGFSRERGILVPNDDIPAIVLLGRLYATGQHSLTTVADALNAAGYTIRDPKTGVRKLWGKYAVEEVLKNPVYRGKVVCAGETFDGKQPVIWDDATWAAIHDALTRRSRYRHTPEARPKGVGGMLTTLARCSRCGGNLWHQNRGAGGSRRYYRCSGIDRRTCGVSMSHADDVEQQVLDLMPQLTLPADWHERALEFVQARRQAQASTRPTEDRAAIEQRLKRLARLYEDGMKSDEDYQRERDRLRSMLQEQPVSVPMQANLEEAAKRLHDLPTLLAQATMLQRRAVLAHLFSDIWIERNEIVALTPTRVLFPLMYAVWAGWASELHHVPPPPHDIAPPALWQSWKVAL